MSVNEDNQNWPPKPSEGEPPGRPANLPMVSPVPLGIASCVLILSLFGANIIFLLYTSLCRDTRGKVWVGTEDQGVYRLDPAAPKATQYTHFTTKDGLGDDNADGDGLRQARADVGRDAQPRGECLHGE